MQVKFHQLCWINEMEGKESFPSSLHMERSWALLYTKNSDKSRMESPLPCLQVGDFHVHISCPKYTQHSAMGSKGSLVPYELAVLNRNAVSTMHLPVGSPLAQEPGISLETHGQFICIPRAFPGKVDEIVLMHVDDTNYAILMELCVHHLTEGENKGVHTG